MAEYTLIDGISVIKAVIPTAEDAGGICEYNGKIYVAGGYPNGTKHYVYDPSLNLWSDAPTDLPVRRWDCGSARVGKYFYIVGGSTDANAYKTLYRYDLDLGGAWVSMTASTYQYAKTAVGADDNFIYVIGSNWAVIHKHAEKYSITGDSWTILNDAPAQIYASTPKVVDGHLYLMTHNSGGTNPNNFWRYDTATDTYTPLADFTLLDVYIPTYQLGYFGGYVYCFGGAERIGALNYKTNRVFRYCIDTNIWEEIAPLNYARMLANVIDYEGIFYIVGGRACTGDPDVGARYNFNEEYNPPPPPAAEVGLPEIAAASLAAADAVLVVVYILKHFKVID